MAAPSDNWTRKDLTSSLPRTGEGVIVDIGTGDGLFVYQCARENPNKFYIGIDANAQPLEKISEKIHRKPSKGGAANLLFVQSSVENLPSEFTGVADEVHIHFPWGSLLRAVATGDITVLKGLRRICSSDALLEIALGLDPIRDKTEIARLGIESFSPDFIDTDLTSRYRSAGFEIIEKGRLSPGEWPEAVKTSWAKRLQGSDSRFVTYIVARAV